MVAHIVGNLLFLFINMISIKKNKNSMEKISIISFLLGCIVYITYWVMVIIDLKTNGFGTQSFSMLILSWAF